MLVVSQTHKCISLYFQIPEELYALTGNLRTLDISENKIPRIPSAFARFSMLKTLQISFNRLSMKISQSVFILH